MLPRLDNHRWRRATLLLVVLLPGLAAGRGEAATRGPLPDAGDVVGAFEVARRWVSAFAPPLETDPAAEVPIRGAAGVCVILRQGGITYGVGTDEAGDALMLRRATARALRDVWHHPTFAGLDDLTRSSLGRSMSIELEVAGTPRPLLGRTWGQVAERLEPGLEGIALRRGDVWRFRFPAQMRLTNAARDVELVATGLVAEFNLPLDDLDRLRSAEGLAVYSFAVTGLAQRSAHAVPFAPFRGGVIVTPNEVSPASIARTAHAIANHVCGAVWPDPPPPAGADPASGPVRTSFGLLGTYRPSSDQYRPLVAPPLEQAMMGEALFRYARSPHVDPNSAARARRTALRILEDLAIVDESERAPTETPAAAAALLCAALERSQEAMSLALASTIDDAKLIVLSCFDEETGRLGPPPGMDAAGALTPTEQALVCAAMSRLLRAQPSPADARRVRAALDAAWASVADHEAVDLLPWIGWAELDYAAVSGPHEEARVRLIALGDALASSQADSWTGRDGADETRLAADLDGAFLLQRASGRLTATSQSLRPAAWLARTLAHAGFLPADERPAERDRQLAHARYLMQLTIRESGSWAYRNPARSLGGVRNAVWDSDLPLPAQALGLMVAVDLLEGVRAVAGGEGDL